MSDSTRFFVMSILNMFICSYAKKRLAKDGKQITLKKYMKFIAFMVVLLGINQLIFFGFQQNNLYEEIEMPRSLPINQIKAHQKELQLKIMLQAHIPLKERMQTIRRIQLIVKVLEHPARRLSYDTFGLADTEYAWAFKSQPFLLQAIIGSSVFYIMCIVMNMISKSKDQMKQALKIEIMIIFLVFICEVQIIMQTENRFHQTTDWLDHIYPSFPIFQRRELMKVLLLPITNVCYFFLMFYVPHESEKKLLKVAKHPTLRNMTSQVRDHLSKVKQDQHLEDRISVAIAQIKGTHPLQSELYLRHRQIVRGIFISENQNILVDQEIMQALNYFHLLNLCQKPEQPEQSEQPEQPEQLEQPEQTQQPQPHED